MTYIRNTIYASGLALLLTACGGGGGSETPVSFDAPPPPPVSESEYDKQTKAAQDQFAARLAASLADSETWMDNNRREDGVVTTQSGLQYKVNTSTPNLIEGWKEVLTLMKPGDQWTVFMPPNLAYGAEGKGDAVPPNAVLVFEIDLR